MIRYQIVNYDNAHTTAEIIFRGLMIRMRCRLQPYLREGARRCPI